MLVVKISRQVSLPVCVVSIGNEGCIDITFSITKVGISGLPVFPWIDTSCDNYTRNVFFTEIIIEPKFHIIPVALIVTPCFLVGRAVKRTALIKFPVDP